MHAAVQNKVDRIILAFSSSTYGDHRELPKVEKNIGKPLSPYAVTKAAIEQFADVFGKTYGLKWIGLRYFNVLALNKIRKIHMLLLFQFLLKHFLLVVKSQ